VKKGKRPRSTTLPGSAVARWEGFIPIGGSARARLLEEALAAFGRDGYAVTAVADLARRSGFTTGAIYHHFGSKAGLYDVVRTEVERRIRDRMQGASEAGAALSTVIAVGLDAARSLGVVGMLAEDAPVPRHDVLHPLIAEWAQSVHPGAGKLVVGIWTAALRALADGDDPDQIRAAVFHLVR
jgi:AcrR family transcriptional regulator